jgi:hypothetical protein
MDPQKSKDYGPASFSHKNSKPASHPWADPILCPPLPSPVSITVEKALEFYLVTSPPDSAHRG